MEANPKETNQSLEMSLQQAKAEMIGATNLIMRKHNLPPCLMDGILSSLLADIRSAEIVSVLKEESEKNG